MVKSCTFNRREVVIWGVLGAATFNLPAIARADARTAPPSGLPPVSVERFDDRLAQILPSSASMEILASGFEWAEGPTWDQKRERLYFSDIPNNRINYWSKALGLGVWREPAGSGGAPDFVMPGSNGLLYSSSSDELLVCDQDSRSILAYDPDGGPARVVVRGPEGDPFISPNDLVMGRDGSLYFTDPPFGFVEGKARPETPRKVSGVYRRLSNGRIELIDGSLKFPNGIGISPDGGHLYVSISDPVWPRVVRFTAEGNGWRRDGDCWFDMRVFQHDGSAGMPDGMDVASDGTLFIAAPGGIAILSEKGEPLGRLVTGRATGNCCFGEDGSTLFITADDLLLRIRTSARGVAFS